MKTFKNTINFAVLLMLCICLDLSAAEKEIHLYLDADMSNMHISGKSIERGIRTALAQAGNKIHGMPVKLIVADHRGNVLRSKENLLAFARDPQALALFCGLHSQPMLVWSKLISQKRLLVLDPWAAAGPVTRKTNRQGENWVFRLSVDDTKAGEFLVAQAIDKAGYKRPALILDDTGWGKSNYETLAKALKNRNIEPTDVYYFNWKIGKAGAHEMLSSIFKDKSDVIFLVANTPEGIGIARSMGERPQEERIPIYSHWGITGGDLFEKVGKGTLNEKIQLKFIQTPYSFLAEPLSAEGKGAFSELQKIDPSVKTLKDISAPTGFIHAYDLTKILLQAAKECEWSQDMAINRNNLRLKLEDLQTPVKGLIRTYSKPFTSYGPENPDAHEALGIADLRLGYYDSEGNIRLEDQK